MPLLTQAEVDHRRAVGHALIERLFALEKLPQIEAHKLACGTISAAVLSTGHL